VLVAAQFAGTSPWFATNAVLPELRAALDLGPGAAGALTSAVQLGFIAGTLVYAALRLADRISPSRLFTASALAAALANLAVTFRPDDYAAILALRVATGVFLAGVYPVGMKLASDWFDGGLGRALGWLVGALVLGTAFPHLLAAASLELPWTAVVQATSALAAAGGLAVARWVPDGPHRRPGGRVSPAGLRALARIRPLRRAALGYVGHMWELYAFWAFVPLLIAARPGLDDPRAVSVAAFAVVAAGALGCVAGGLVAARVGSGRVAGALVATSGLACLTAPASFAAPLPLFAAVLAVWGVAVAGDSPQFSTLVARAAPPEVRGSALTFVNAIGFAVTLPALTLLGELATRWPAPLWFVPLAVGPALSVWVLTRPSARRAQ
jgi:MFS family permease